MAITDYLTAIADAIRKKTGRKEKIKLHEMADLIESISVEESFPEYSGLYEITPSFEVQSLETKDTVLREDISVDKIKVTETSNTSNGKTLII